MENENVCCFECGSRNINRDFGDSRRYFCNECEKYFYIRDRPYSKLCDTCGKHFLVEDNNVIVCSECKEKILTKQPSASNVVSVKTELFITKNGKNVKLRPKKRKIVKNNEKYKNMQNYDLYRVLTTRQKIELYKKYNYTFDFNVDDIDDICSTWLDSMDSERIRELLFEGFEL